MNALSQLHAPDAPRGRCQRVFASNRVCTARLSKANKSGACYPCLQGWREDDPRRARFGEREPGPRMVSPEPPPSIAPAELWRLLSDTRRDLQIQQELVRQLRQGKAEFDKTMTRVSALVEELEAVLPGASVDLADRARDMVGKVRHLEADLLSTGRERDVAKQEVAMLRGHGGAPLPAEATLEQLVTYVTECNRRLTNMAAQAGVEEKA